MFTTINEARIRAGGHGLACTTGALQGAAQYARDRVQGRPVGMSKEDAKNSTIIDHADVRRMLMSIKSYSDAMRYMMYDSQMMLDFSYFGDEDTKDFGEERCGILTPISKAWISDLSVELTSMAIQVYGGMGYVEETGIAQYFRDARIAPIYAGTNGIQALDLIFRKISLNEGNAVNELFKDIEETTKELIDNNDFKNLGKILSNHLTQLKKITNLLNIKLNEGDLTHASGVATPYLKMFGQILGGYYMGKAALTAQKQITDKDSEFYNDKITLSKFYIEQLLPLASGYEQSIKSDVDVLFRINSENF